VSQFLSCWLFQLRIARVSRKELMDKITTGENIAIVDLRQSMGDKKKELAQAIGRILCGSPTIDSVAGSAINHR
jgi:hypothetical protein